MPVTTKTTVSFPFPGRLAGLDGGRNREGRSFSDNFIAFLLSYGAKFDCLWPRPAAITVLDARAVFFQFSFPMKKVVAGRKAKAPSGRSCSSGRQIRLPGTKHSRTKEYKNKTKTKLNPPSTRVLYIFYACTYTYGYVRVCCWTQTKSPSTTGINRFGNWLFFAVFSIFVIFYFFLTLKTHFVGLSRKWKRTQL